jgi:hypothetical protein
MNTNEKPFDINSYFTKDLLKAMSEMSPSDMNSALLSLESTRAWIALLKYVSGRQMYTEGVLKSADPVKEPTQIARSQGILMGLSDIINNVVMLKANIRREDEEAEGTKAQRME